MAIQPNRVKPTQTPRPQRHPRWLPRRPPGDLLGRPHTAASDTPRQKNYPRSALTDQSLPASLPDPSPWNLHAGINLKAESITGCIYSEAHRLAPSQPHAHRRTCPTARAVSDPREKGKNRQAQSRSPKASSSFAQKRSPRPKIRYPNRSQKNARYPSCQPPQHKNCPPKNTRLGGFRSPKIATT